MRPPRNPALYSFEAALANRLEQHDSGRHRHVQTLDVTPHRNRHEPVAALPHQPPQPVPSAPTTRAVGSVKSISIVASSARRRPARPSRPPPPSASSSARAMFTTSAILTCDDRAGRRLGRRAAERRRVPRLADDAVGAGRIDRPQDRADVVRILDAVEHDDAAARPRAGSTRSSTLNVSVVAHVGDDALMHAAARRAIEIAGAHAPHRHALAPPRAARAAATRSSARADTRIAVTRPARSASRTGLMP